MMLRNRWMIGLTAALAVSGAEAASTSRVPVFVNDQELSADALMLKNVNRTVLPMRTLFESLGARVEWDPAEQAVYAWKPDGTGVRLALGYRFAQTMRMRSNPQPGNWGTASATRPLDAPAMMVGSRVYVPIRFAAEALKADVRYSAYEPAVHIRTDRVAGSREEDVDPAERERLQRERLERERTERERIESTRVTRDTRVRIRELQDALSVTVELNGEEFPRGGRPIPIRFMVRNETERPLTIPFSTGQQFDVEIVKDGRILWNWAHDRAFTEARTELRLDNAEEKAFTLRWNLRNNNGARVHPGRYTVRGILTTSLGRRDIVAEDAITITE